MRTLEEVTEPDPKRVAAYEQTYEVYRGLYGPLREDMHRLVELASTEER